MGEQGYTTGHWLTLTQDINAVRQCLMHCCLMVFAHCSVRQQKAQLSPGKTCYSLYSSCCST